MLDYTLSVFFFFAIFCFLTYSCTWFGRTLRNYQFEMARQAQAQNRATSGDCRISVYTIERGAQRQTVINYGSNSSPTNNKDDLPPAYAEAIKMSLMTPQPLQNPTTSPLQNTLPRRNSSTI